MSLLSNLKTESDVVGESDYLGGGAPLLDSALYTFKVELAYLQKSEKGATGLFLTLKNDEHELKQAIYVTGGDDKGNLPYFIDQKTKEKRYLPGFNLANSLALLTTGKQFADLETDNKVLNIYNYKSKAEVPTTVEVVTDLLGQEIVAGVIRQTVDVRKQDASGAYYNTGDTRDENEIDKFFCAKEKYLNMTSTEIKSKAEAAVFAGQWSEKHTGKTKDRSTKESGATGGPKKLGAATAATSKPKESLFGED